ncbi:MAG: zinc-ribbon domain-containing protein [Clostridium sp.]
MFCTNCGREIDNNVEICPLCGVKTRVVETVIERVVEPAKVTTVDNPSHFAGIVSCCFPVVGLILYFIWEDQKPKSSKLICYWMLGGTAAWVLFYILFVVIGVASGFSTY